MNGKDREKANKIANSLLSPSANNLKSSLKTELMAISRISEALQYLDKELVNASKMMAEWAVCVEDEGSNE